MSLSMKIFFSPSCIYIDDFCLLEMMGEFVDDLQIK